MQVIKLKKSLFKVRLITFFVLLNVLFFQLNALDLYMFLGAPGSGKGTLAAKCVKELNFKILSTGNLCREEIASGSQKGKLIKGYSLTTGLVPDDIISEIVANWLKNQTDDKSIIFDGYPRTKNQAQLFIKMLNKLFSSSYCLHIIYLEIFDEKELLERILNRLVCENKKCQATYNSKDFDKIQQKVCSICGGRLTKRDDDKEDIIRTRLKGFFENNKEIISFYSNLNFNIIKINVSNVLPAQVFMDFKKKLNFM